MTRFVKLLAVMMLICLFTLAFASCSSDNGQSGETTPVISENTSDSGQSAETDVKQTETTEGEAVFPTDLGNGTVYYVSVNDGDDSNDGKSAEKPFRTLDAVNALALNEGDSVLLKRGETFIGGHIIINGTGKAGDGKWITLDAYGAGENPILKTPSQNAPAISFEKSFGGCRIRNITIDGYLQGIGSRKSVNDGILKDVIISDCSIVNITLNRAAESGDSAFLPNGASLAYGMLLHNAENITVLNVKFDNNDCPIRILGGNSVFDGLEISDSHIQGIMIYGAEGDLPYDKIMSTTGNITVKNSRILFTGDRAATFGTAGILVEDIHDCLIQNVEIAYTMNTLGGFDACAVDWEQNNINCTLDGVYAHDNYGPMVLVLEHSKTVGNSRGNVIKNCVSVNNALHGDCEVGSFMNASSYPNANQKITVENCYDIGRAESSDYMGDGTLGSIKASKKVNESNYISGITDVYETFDTASKVFKDMSKASIVDAHLQMSAGASLFTEYKSRNYNFSVMLNGDTEVYFMSDDNGGNGYKWTITSGKAVFDKVLGGNAMSLGSADLDLGDKWYRLRVVLESGSINTYIDDTLISSIKDATFTYGAVGFKSINGGAMDNFYIYKLEENYREVHNYDVDSDGKKYIFAPVGDGNFTNEKNLKEHNIDGWQFRPYDAGWGKISEAGAYLIVKNVNMDASLVDSVEIVLMNGSDSGRVWIEFSTNSGKDWYGKCIDTAYKGSDIYGAFGNPVFDKYSVLLSDDEHWSGTVNGLRVRFEGTQGSVAIKKLTFFAGEPEKEEETEYSDVKYKDSGFGGWVEDWLHIYREPTTVSKLHMRVDSESGHLIFDSKNCTEMFVLNNDSEDAYEEHNRKNFPASDMAKAFTLEFDMDFSGSYFAFCFGGKSDTNVTDGYMTVAFIDSWTFIKSENIGGKSEIDTDNLKASINGTGKRHIIIGYADNKLNVTVDGEVYWKDYKIDSKQIAKGYIGFFFQSTDNSGYIANLKVTNGVSGYSQTFFADKK